MPRHRMIIELDVEDLRRAMLPTGRRPEPRFTAEAYSLALEGMKAIAPRGARDIRLMGTVDTFVLTWVGTELVPAAEVAERIREFRKGK